MASVMSGSHFSMGPSPAEGEPQGRQRAKLCVGLEVQGHFLSEAQVCARITKTIDALKDAFSLVLQAIPPWQPFQVPGLKESIDASFMIYRKIVSLTLDGLELEELLGVCEFLDGWHTSIQELAGFLAADLASFVPPAGGPMAPWSGRSQRAAVPADKEAQLETPSMDSDLDPEESEWESDDDRAFGILQQELYFEPPEVQFTIMSNLVKCAHALTGLQLEKMEHADEAERALLLELKDLSHQAMAIGTQFKETMLAADQADRPTPCPVRLLKRALSCEKRLLREILWLGGHDVVQELQLASLPGVGHERPSQDNAEDNADLVGNSYNSDSTAYNSLEASPCSSKSGRADVRMGA